MKRSLILVLASVGSLVACATTPPDRVAAEADAVSLAISDEDILARLSEAVGERVCISGELVNGHNVPAFMLPKDQPEIFEYGHRVTLSIRLADAFRRGMEVPGFHRTCGMLEQVEHSRNDYLLMID